MLKRSLIPLLFLAILNVPLRGSAQAGYPRIPKQVPPRRSTQLVDGFGMNVSLPRDPTLPWRKRWWTRMFDSGVKRLRIGQYENSSERTSWDWVERTPQNEIPSGHVTYRVRVSGENGPSAWSNPAWVDSQAEAASK